MTPILGDRTALFPELTAKAYVAHAAISPASVNVTARVHRVVRDYAHQGLPAFMQWHERREDIRVTLAELVGAAPTDIGFIPNTTRGVNAIALGFPWNEGDRVVLLDGEFPANVTPWQQAGALFGVEPIFVPVADFGGDADRGLAKLEDAFKSGARLVAVSSVQFQTGLRMPLREMAEVAHANGGEIFVDGIQGCGVVPIDVKTAGIDYLTCGSHKWLMGLEGCGFLYVSPDRVDALRPAVAGWTSHENALDFLFAGPGHLKYDRPIRKHADFVEGGAYNTIGLAALDVAVQTLQELGIEKIYGHVQRWHDALEPLLVEKGFRSVRDSHVERRSGILSFLPPEGAELQAIDAQLSAAGVTASIPDGHLRFAPHWPNALDEVELIADVILR